MMVPTVRSLSEQGLDTRDIEIITDVRDHGWHVVAVVEENGVPGWAHSVGLYKTFGHPEVVVFGLANDVLAGLIDDIAEEVRAGRRFACGDLHGDLLEGTPCLFKPVHRDWYPALLPDAEWFYCGGSFPLIQCFWPDGDSRFPWQSGFAEEWVVLQPLLFRRDPEQARAVELLESMRPST